MSNTAKVSVVIPTYNRPEFLDKAITSVLNQSFQDFDIIVVDDASEANINEIIHAFNDKRIHYIRHTTNRGGAATRNTGIINTSSRYIAFLDDDDEWIPNKLQMQVELLDNSPLHVGGVYTGYLSVDRKSDAVWCVHRPTKRGNIFNDLLHANWIGGTSSMLLRRECFAKVGLFDETLPSFQDYDLWIRISREFEFDYLEPPLLKYYLHQKKISTNFKALRNGMEIMLKKYAGHSIFKKPFRKQFSYGFLALGVQCCNEGNIKEGREAFLRAIRLYPFEVRHYFNICLSLFGGKAFRRLKGIKDILMVPLRKPMASSLTSKGSNPMP